MKPSDDQLISHIKKTLATHEEPYRPGAWENFNESTAKKKKQVFGFYQFLNVAAMILVCAFIFLFVDKAVQNPQQDLVNTKKSSAKPSSPAPSAGQKDTITNGPAAGEVYARNSVEQSISKSEDASATSSPSALKPFKAQTENFIERTTNAAMAAVSRTFGKPLADAVIDQNLVMQVKPKAKTVDAVEPVPQASATVENKPAEQASSFENFLKQEQLANNKNTTEKSSTNKDKWEMGLMVAPSIGNSNKLNLGYGISMGYALSKKVSVVSGISYNDMTASNQVSSPINTASIVSGNAKNLESIEADISGIDIPLGIKYNLSKKVYANVGVSAFAVLNQRQSNTYLQETTVQSASTDPNTFGEVRIMVMNQRVTEKAPEAAVDSKLIGFYNLSFGVKQPLSKKNTLSLEPFVKLPMKESGPENLKMIGTGIKLKLDF